MKGKDKEICLKIREMRKSLKLTQSQFAELCNISEDSIGKIERCVTVPRIGTLYKIAKNLKQPIESFLPSFRENQCISLSEELSALVSYLKIQSTEDVKFIHELAIKIFERKK